MSPAPRKMFSWWLVDCTVCNHTHIWYNTVRYLAALEWRSPNSGLQQSSAPG